MAVAVRAVLLALALAPPTLAQTPSLVPTPATTQSEPSPQDEADQRTVRITTLRELVVDIQDPERREDLIARIEALILAAEGGEETAVEESQESGPIDRLVAFFRQLSDEAGHTVTSVVNQAGTIPARLRSFEASLADPEQRRVFLTQAGYTAGVVVATLLAYLLGWLLLRRPRFALGRNRSGRPLRTGGRLWRLVLRLLVDLGPAAAAVAVAFTGLSLLQIRPAGGAIALAFAMALACRGLVRALIHAVLSPTAAEIRIPSVEDAPASELARALSRTSAFAIYGYFLIVAVGATGAEQELLAALRGLYGLILLVIGVVVVLRFRRWPASSVADTAAAAEPDSAAIAPADGAAEAAATPEGPKKPRARWRGLVRAAISLWWLVALVYMFGLYALWVSGIAGAFWTAMQATLITLLTVVLAIAAYALGDAVLRRGGVKLVSATKALPAIRRRVPHYLSGARFVLGGAIALVAAGFVLEAWGIGAIDALQSEAVRAVLSAVLGVLAVVFLAFAAIDVSTALTESYLSRKQRHSQDSAKLRTLVPLAQKTIKLVVWVIAGLTILGQIGISIGPILASIGVLGLAIGFGAQTLVKDIITGVFILLEDAVSVGDVVQIDGTGGLVEAINIRTIRLRDLSGVVHTIPYSTVGQFANLTKEFSCYVIDCRVAYREDIDEVIAVLQEIGAELQKDPKFGPNMLAPLEIIGLDAFEDSAVLVRARLTCKPGAQWSTGREFNRRMKRVFDERGIEIPFPHRTIYIGADKQGASPPLNLAGLNGAAAAMAGRERTGEAG